MIALVWGGGRVVYELVYSGRSSYFSLFFLSLSPCFITMELSALFFFFVADNFTFVFAVFAVVVIKEKHGRNIVFGG